MGHKLKYTIGNAGDIIKHGLLAEFVAWWSETHANRVLRMADPFGGCPWGNLEELVNRNFAKYKESQLSDWAFSIRCPKMENSRFDWEILLVSRQIKDCKCERLYERLQSFVEQAERALKTSLELWGR